MIVCSHTSVACLVTRHRSAVGSRPEVCPSRPDLNLVSRLADVRHASLEVYSSPPSRALGSECFGNPQRKLVSLTVI